MDEFELEGCSIKSPVFCNHRRGKNRAAVKVCDRLIDLAVTNGADGNFYWDVVDGVTSLASGDAETVDDARKAAENAARRKIFS